MTALSPTSVAARVNRPTTAEIDASTRGPLLLMAAASVKWLILSLAVGFLATLKLHASNLLAGVPFLTYGRLVGLQDSVFIFGFASQAALAVSLWLICRLGGTPLIGRGPVVIAALVWNFGVLVGSLGILAGNGSPFEHLQFPHSAYPIFFFAHCVIGVCALLTFAARRESVIYPSLWFVLAGLVFFPWTLVSASMTLWSPNIGPAALPLIAAWAANNLVMSWLAPVALASVFYFLPKLAGKSLHSASMAVFAFWLFILFGQTTNMHASAAFPAWVGTTSELATMLLVLPALAMALNWRLTLGGAGKKKDSEVAYRFAWWGAALFVLWIVVAALSATRNINRLVEFTIFQTGLSHLALLGFFSLSIFAAFTYILPRVTEFEWPRPAFTSLHFTLSLVGAIFIFVPLLLGGLVQGAKAGDETTVYVDVVHSTFAFIGMTYLGFTLMIVAQLAFLANVAKLAWTSCLACCCAESGGKR